MSTPQLSPTLAINAQVAARRAAGEEIVHLGFGEAGLPVHPLLAGALAAGAARNSYEPGGGTPALRTAIAGWFGRRGMPTDPSTVYAAPGSKAVLYGLMAALDGDVVLPCPAWVSYAPHARLLGRHVLSHPVPDACGGIPDPATLPQALEAARAAGQDPRILVVTIPDNPTGTSASSELVEQVVAIAREHELTIICDEVYRDMADDPDGLPSVSALAPDTTFVTTGLSKTHALGGWRVGVVRVPDSELGASTRARLVSFGSEVWSCIPGPIAEAAQLAYEEPEELRRWVSDARDVHRTLRTAVYEIVARSGLDCRAPTAGFYMYPGVSARSGALPTDMAVAEFLLERGGVAVLPGSAFGDAPEALRFRIATSLLCGEDDAQRWEAVEASRAGSLTSLPRIAAALERVETAFGAVGALARGPF